MPLHLTRVLLLAASAFLALPGARAATVLATFEGELTSVSAGLSGTFSVEDAITIVYTYDSSVTTDLNAAASIGEYEAATDLTMTIFAVSGDFDYGQTGSPGRVLVAAEESGAALDIFRTRFLNVTGDAVVGTTQPFSVTLQISGTGIVPSTALPDPHPGLGGSPLFLATIAMGSGLQLQANMQLLDLTPAGVVPLPAGLWLLLSGLGVLAGVRARGSR
jgi:hypothetical protein